MYIKVIDRNKNEILLNTDYIVSIERDINGVKVISTSGDYFYLKDEFQFFEEILMKKDTKKRSQ